MIPALPCQMETDDGWKLATATVVSSTAEWEGLRYDTETQDAKFPRYKTSFEYLVGETRYRGEYSTGTEQEEGMQFEILYDPKEPSRNTLSRGRFPWGLRLLVWAFAAALVVALVWLGNHYLPAE